MVFVCTEYGSNYAEIASVTVPVLRQYADKHGYECREILLHGTGNEYYYKKIEFFEELFKDPKIKAVFYLDADAIITNLNITVESFLDEKHDLYIAEIGGELNGGALILKNTSGGRWIIETILQEKNNFGNEQNVINFYKEFPPFKQIMKVVPHPCFNSIDCSMYPEFENLRAREDGHWHEGDFIFHAPALSINKRKEVLENVRITI